MNVGKSISMALCVLLLTKCGADKMPADDSANLPSYDIEMQEIINSQSEEIAALKEDISNLEKENDRLKENQNVADDPSYISNSEDQGDSNQAKESNSSQAASEKIVERIVYVEVPVPCSCTSASSSEIIVTMAELRGKTEAQAKADLDSMGLKYQIEYCTNDKGVASNGLVQSTTPQSGEQVYAGSTVIKIMVYKNYLMPDMSDYIGKPVDTLTGYLASMGVPYNPNSTGTKDTTDQALNGCVAGISYGVGIGGEVTSDSPALSFSTYSYF